MFLRCLMLITSVFLLATPASAQLGSTISYRSPTFTRSPSYSSPSTINTLSPTFRSRYGYGSYSPQAHWGGRFSNTPSYRSYNSSNYYRSVLASPRGLDASRGLYGSSGIRTYTSDR